MRLELDLSPGDWADYKQAPLAVLSLAEIPFRVLRAAALAVCPPDTHDVFESEEVCDD